MACDLEDLFVIEEDFSCIAQIATHCDWDALCQFTRERQNIDILNLLGNAFYLDVLTNKDDPDYQDLMCGSTYKDCDDNDVIHFGLKRVLVHFAYAAYIYRHGFVDTPYSVVQKQSQDSLPVSTTDLKTLRNENRLLADNYWKMTHNYLCQNQETFSIFNPCDCKDCDCDNEDVNIRSYSTNVIRK